ncbi:MAG: hypothetical protein AMXMBFR84_07030 [Candidatus Hydrogenedentota bacterium]
MNSDLIELLHHFAKYEVRYLIVGGHAVMRYSEPRYTKDVDLWVAGDVAGSESVYQALRDFGAPLTGLTQADFRAGDYVYQMGREPFRVNILLALPGLDFDAAWQRRELDVFAGVPAHYISREGLISSKLASGRPVDLLDVDRLRAFQKDE